MLRRVLALLLALSATAGVVWLGNPSVGALLKVGSPLHFSLTKVKPKDLTLVCPGAAFATGGSSGTNISSFNRTGNSIIDYGSQLPTGVTMRTLALTGPAASHQPLGDTQRKIGAVNAVSSVSISVQDPLSVAVQSSNLLTAQSYQILGGGSIAGALGANCQNPATDAWFVGGVTTIGRESLLILANPTATDATVNLQIYGDQGPIEGAGLNGISVSANRTVVLPLAGFAPQQESLAVHLESAGAAIAGWIQERTVRGTVSAGADLISPSVPAAKQLTIPGLFKRGTADASALIAQNSDYQDLTPSVQVFVPGTAPTTVTVQVIGADAKTLGTVAQQQVPANSAATIDLPGLKDGNYAVFLEADHPILGAVKLSRTKKTNTPITDFAWLPSVQPQSSQLAVTSPKSAIAKLSIANPSRLVATATVTNLSTGKSQQITVPQLGSAVVVAPAGALVSVSADHPVATTMITDFNWLIAAIPLVDYRNVGGQLAVLVR